MSVAQLGWLYTVNHKNRDILFLTITSASLNRFLWFLYHFNHEEILHATVVKFTTSPSLCEHLTLYNFVNLNNNTFQLKMLLFFVHLRSQQKRTESPLQLSNLQCCYFDIAILRVAIISNVQNVRLQRRHRLTDDASTRRWRGSQQTGSVRTTR